ncbi:MAG: hypothetical protein K9L22_06065 [Methylococcaceae bacterium]|nr:hypothetical protein [Methylococcaceae bacterium]
MKTQRKLSCLILVIYGLFSGLNWAHAERAHNGHGHGHGHGSDHRTGGHWRGGGHRNSSFGFYFGAPLYPYPYPYYRYSYPYYPPTVIVRPSPPVYIQQAPPATQKNSSEYWYYCNNPEGYYPYIRVCPSGWEQVEPIPPTSN